MRFSLFASGLAAALLPASLAFAADADGTAKANAPRPDHPAHVFMRCCPAPGKMVEAAYLGLYTEAIPLERADDLGLPPGTGLSVAAVAPGSPAEKAGFQAHDVLAKLGDQLLVNPAQLRVLVRQRKAGETVSFDIVRKGKPQAIKAELGSHAMPELTPGGEEPQMMFGGGPQGGVHSFRAAPGEPMPPEMLRGLPKELREQIEKMGSAPLAPRGDKEADDETTTEGSISLDASNDPLVSSGFTSRAVSRDARHTIEIERGRREHLLVTDNDGKKLYDGPIPTDDKGWEKVPEEVRTKAKNLVGNTRVNAKADAKPAEVSPEKKDTDKGTSF